MRVSVPPYSKEYSVVSLALTNEAHTDLLEEGASHWFLNGDNLVIFPDQISVAMDDSAKELLTECADYDAFEVYPDGTATRCYDSQSDDVVFYITGKCNSNCIMCPMAERIRRESEAADIDRMIMIARQVPENVEHITVTGGEPFLAGGDLFRLFDFFKSKFARTEFLILTNGRALAIPAYRDQLINTLPDNSILGIPIHGASPESHDRITQSPGSFRQTMVGLRAVQEKGLRTELRIVVNQWNCNELTRMAEMIERELPRVERVCIMAMEMTGAAFVNKRKIWIPYRQAFECLKPAADKLIEAGIDVRLYNFPLCTVAPSYWTVCHKSISPEKIKYSDCCTACSVKDACGGVFAGTFLMVRNELMPV